MNKIVLLSLLLIVLSSNVTCKVNMRIFRPHYHAIEYYKMPLSCMNKTYCFDKGTRYLKTKDIRDVLNEEMFMNIEEEDNASTELQDKLSDNECSTIYHNKTIYYVRDKENRTRAVIQSDISGRKFTQNYEIRHCEQEGVKRHGKKYIKEQLLELLKLEMKCENSYLDVDFYVMGEGKKKEMEKVQVSIPVYCKCRLQKKY